VTRAAAAFTLALLATAELLAPTAGTVRFMRIANSAFDRYTKSPDPAQQKWMNGGFRRRAGARAIESAMNAMACAVPRASTPH